VEKKRIENLQEGERKGETKKDRANIEIENEECGLIEMGHGWGGGWGGST
jgi:hypothetical protein